LQNKLTTPGEGGNF